MMSDIREEVDYTFIQSEDDSSLANVKLISGEYEGIVYSYGKVSVEEDEENDTAYLSFAFNIVDPNGFDNIEENLEFKNYIGEVLTTIMTANLPNS